MRPSLQFCGRRGTEMEQEREGSFDGFLKWAAALGISDSPVCVNTRSALGHSLAVSHFPLAGGRGLAAVRDLRKGELILRVPKSALITRQIFLESDAKLAAALASHCCSLSPNQTLALCLLNEVNKGKRSFWLPYLMHLPRAYQILAAFGAFETNALQVLFLSVDDAIWAAERAVSRAKSEWKEANKLMEELKLKPQLLTFRAWLWASGTISSRTLHVPWDEAGCLCPVGDLFNYAAPSEDSNNFENVDPFGNAATDLSTEQFDPQLKRLTDGGFEEDVGAYCFYAGKSYKIGEQVLLGYGTYTNLELLEHYGFLLDENPNDKVFIPLDHDIFSSSSWPKDVLYVHQNGKPSFALMCALRLWSIPRNQRRSVGHLAYSGCQLSVENELHVLEWISAKCRALLKNLPTSSEEDCLLLSAISKMEELNGDVAIELRKMALAVEAEVQKFLDACGAKNGEFLSSRRVETSLERWKLVVRWRLRYKQVLEACVDYCTETACYLEHKS